MDFIVFFGIFSSFQQIGVEVKHVFWEKLLLLPEPIQVKHIFLLHVLQIIIQGIGFETSLDFAKRGARVILACRDLEKANEAKTKIIEETGNTNIITKVLNLASFESVKNFANDIIANEDKLDILVNNAGIGGVGDKKTIDGNCLLMQVNYFSSFLLTNLLINLLKKSAPSRIVNVSSLLAAFASFQIDKINDFNGTKNTYSCSKLCNILFTIQLAKEIEGSGVTTYSVHPGLVKTAIFRRSRGLFKTIIDLFKDKIFRVINGYFLVLDEKHIILDTCRRSPNNNLCSYNKRFRAF